MDQSIEDFQKVVWDFYKARGRHEMLWRIPNAAGEFDPYKILVSEMMLQQTQVARVATKYPEFIAAFPSVSALAQSSLGDVLRVWQGLGYNRRAQYLWKTAQIVMTEYNGIFPQSINELVKLPGIGSNTAGAITAYSWNVPTVFIETNIRTVFIHHFFTDQSSIADMELRTIVQNSLPIEPGKTREWYWALMDYGSYLKQTIGNLNKLSKTYTKQSTFSGSKRQIRGMVIRLLIIEPQTLSMLTKEIKDDRLGDVLEELLAEALIRRNQNTYSL